MAIINFRPVSASLQFSTEAESGSSISLGFDVNLVQGESLKLSSGEKIEDVRLVVGVVPQSSRAADPSKPPGTIHYSEEYSRDFESYPASVRVNATIPDANFDALVKAANSGTVPSEIMVEVDGLDYDWQPDGSGKKWDVAASKRFPITSIRFTVPFVENPKETDPDDPRSQVNSLPATRMQVQQLLASVNDHGTKIVRAVYGALWTIVIAVAVIAYFAHRG